MRSPTVTDVYESTTRVFARELDLAANPGYGEEMSERAEVIRSMARLLSAEFARQDRKYDRDLFLRAVGVDR
jgi:hypothetical protein